MTSATITYLTEREADRAYEQMKRTTDDLARPFRRQGRPANTPEHKAALEAIENCLDQKKTFNPQDAIKLYAFWAMHAEAYDDLKTRLVTKWVDGMTQELSKGQRAFVLDHATNVAHRPLGDLHPLKNAAFAVLDVIENCAPLKASRPPTPREGEAPATPRVA